MAVLKDRLSTGRSIAKYRCVLYQQRVDGTSTLKGSSRVYLVVYNIEGPNLPSIMITIFDLRYYEKIVSIIGGDLGPPARARV